MGGGLTILLAGASGQLGRAMVSACQSQGVEVIPVIRPITGMTATERAARMYPDQKSVADRTFSGDITEARWGLTDADMNRLAPEVDIVVNVAAETNWAASWRRLQSANIVGAANGLNVATELRKRYPRCGAYIYGSSIYVAGGDSGRIPESLQPPRSDRTLYEHSKWLAERHLVHGAHRSPEIAVGLARVGGLLGDSNSGKTAKRNSLYLLTDDSSKRRPLLPVSRNGRVDMLPRDKAAEAFLDVCRATLRLASAEPQVTHVCAGEYAPTLRSLLSVLESIDVNGVKNRPLGVLAPETVIFQTSSHLPQLMKARPRARNRIEGLRYLCIDRVFERSRLVRFMSGPPPSPSTEVLAQLAFAVTAPSPRPVDAENRFARFQ